MAEIVKRGQYRNLYLKFSWRSPGGLGRFGGGWNWKVGAQFGGKTLLLSLLIVEVTISWRARANG